jgi:hypothetical protein
MPWMHSRENGNCTIRTGLLLRDDCFRLIGMMAGGCNATKVVRGVLTRSEGWLLMGGVPKECVTAMEQSSLNSEELLAHIQRGTSWERAHALEQILLSSYDRESLKLRLLRSTALVEGLCEVFMETQSASEFDLISCVLLNIAKDAATRCFLLSHLKFLEFWASTWCSPSIANLLGEGPEDQSNAFSHPSPNISLQVTRTLHALSLISLEGEAKGILGSAASLPTLVAKGLETTDVTLHFLLLSLLGNLVQSSSVAATLSSSVALLTQLARHLDSPYEWESKRQAGDVQASHDIMYQKVCTIAYIFAAMSESKNADITVMAHCPLLLKHVSEWFCYEPGRATMPGHHQQHIVLQKREKEFLLQVLTFVSRTDSNLPMMTHTPEVTESLVQGLRDPDTEVMVSSAQTLQRMMDNSDVFTVLSSNPLFLDSLVNVLTRNVAEGIIAALEMLRLLAGQTEYIAQIADSDKLFPCLVTVLEFFEWNMEIQKGGICLLELLVQDAQARLQVVRETALLKRLYRFVIENQDDLQYFSLNTLQYISFVEEIRPEIAADTDLIAVVVQILHQHQDLYLKAATSLIWNLSSHPAIRRSLIAVRALPQTLVKLLGHDDSEVRLNAVNALWHLSVEPENRIPLAAEDNLVSVLCDELNRRNDISYQRALLNILWNFSMVEVLHDLLVVDCAYPSLMIRLSLDDSLSASQHLHRPIAQAFASLCAIPSTRAHVLNRPMFGTALVRLAMGQRARGRESEGRKSVRWAVFRTIRSVGSDSEGRQILKEEPALIPTLVDALNVEELVGGIVEEVEQAARCLHVLALDNVLRVQMGGEHDIFPLLSSLMMNSCPGPGRATAGWLEIYRASVGTFSRMSYDVRNRGRMMGSELFNDALRHSFAAIPVPEQRKGKAGESDEGTNALAHLLWCLTLDEETRLALSEDLNFLAGAVRLLNSPENSEVHEAIASAAWNLSVESTAQNQLMHFPGLPEALVLHTRNPSRKVVRASLCAISMLSNEKDNRISLLHIPRLLTNVARMAAVEVEAEDLRDITWASTLIQGSTEESFTRILEQCRLKGFKVDEEPLIPAAITVPPPPPPPAEESPTGFGYAFPVWQDTQGIPDIELHRPAVSTLRNLSTVVSEGERIASVSVVPEALARRSLSMDDGLATIAIQSILNLLGTASNRVPLATTEGLLDCVLLHCHSPVAKLQRLAVMCLPMLCFPQSIQPSLARHGALVDTLIYLMQLRNPELQKAGSVALWHLSAAYQNHELLCSLPGVLEVLAPLLLPRRFDGDLPALFKQVEPNELVLGALSCICNFAVEGSNRLRIVKKHSTLEAIVKLLDHPSHEIRDLARRTLMMLFETTADQTESVTPYLESLRGVLKAKNIWVTKPSVKGRH